MSNLDYVLVKDCIDCHWKFGLDAMVRRHKRRPPEERVWIVRESGVTVEDLERIAKQHWLRHQAN